MAGAESHADWAWIPSFAPHTRGSHTRVCGTAPARVAGMHQPPPQRLCPEYPPPAHAALTTATVRGRREPGERYANEVCTGVQRRCGCWACAHLRTAAHTPRRYVPHCAAAPGSAERTGSTVRCNFPLLITLRSSWLSRSRWAATRPPHAAACANQPRTKEAERRGVSHCGVASRWQVAVW
jgi:hypothetical protein